MLLRDFFLLCNLGMVFIYSGSSLAVWTLWDGGWWVARHLCCAAQLNPVFCAQVGVGRRSSNGNMLEHNRSPSLHLTLHQWDGGTHIRSAEYDRGGGCCALISASSVMTSHWTRARKNVSEMIDYGSVGASGDVSWSQERASALLFLEPGR